MSDENKKDDQSAACEASLSAPDGSGPAVTLIQADRIYFEPWRLPIDKAMRFWWKLGEVLGTMTEWKENRMLNPDRQTVLNMSEEEYVEARPHWDMAHWPLPMRMDKAPEYYQSAWRNYSNAAAEAQKVRLGLSRDDGSLMAREHYEGVAYGHFLRAQWRYLQDRNRVRNSTTMTGDEYPSDGEF